MPRKGALFTAFALLNLLGQNTSQAQDIQTGKYYPHDKMDLNQEFIYLTKAPKGYTMKTKLDYASDTESAGWKEIDARLAFYTSRSVIIKDKVSESGINVSGKTKGKAGKVISYPRFELKENSLAKASVTLHNKMWTTKNIHESDIVLSQECYQGKKHVKCEDLEYGVLLGMGFRKGDVYQYNGEKHYLNSRTFWLQRDGDTGNFKLGFKWYDSLNHPAVSFKTSEDWEIPGVKAFRFSKLKVENLNYNIIFDINELATTVPLYLFEKIIEELNGNYGINCPKDEYYRPLCAVGTDLESIQDSGFYFEIKYDYRTFTIPGETIFIVEKINHVDHIRLNLRASSPTLSGRNYVSNRFRNNIIVGSYAMSAFKIKFDMEKALIEVYENPKAPLPAHKEDPYSKFTAEDEEEEVQTKMVDN